MYEIIVEESFSAAHKLRDYQGVCENLHGHNWKVVIVLESEHLNEQGLVVDFKDAKYITEELMFKLDHKYLNELSWFCSKNPTTENISEFLFNELNAKMPDNVYVKKVTTWESDGFGASYYK